MSTPNIKVKFLFEGELRAISINRLNLVELLFGLKTALSVPASSLTLKYIDNEGETVTIGSEPELEEAAQSCNKGLKLIVEKTDKPLCIVAESDKGESSSDSSDSEAQAHDKQETHETEKTLAPHETDAVKTEVPEEISAPKTSVPEDAELTFVSKAEKKGEKKLYQREQKRTEKKNRKELKREKQRAKDLRKQEEKMLRRAMKHKAKEIEQSKPVVSQETKDKLIELENALQQQREKRSREVQALKKEISLKKDEMNEVKRESKLREEELKQMIKELRNTLVNQPKPAATPETQNVQAPCETKEEVQEKEPETCSCPEVKNEAPQVQVFQTEPSQTQVSQSSPNVAGSLSIRGSTYSVSSQAVINSAPPRSNSSIGVDKDNSGWVRARVESDITRPNYKSETENQGQLILANPDCPVLLSVQKSPAPPQSILYYFHPEEFAKQLTLFEHDLYSRINLTCELVSTKFKKEELPQVILDEVDDDAISVNSSALLWQLGDKRLSSPNVMRMIEHLNHLSQWMSTMILKESDIKERKNVMEFFVQCLQHLRKINNFYGIMLMMATFNSAPIARLKKTYALLSTDSKKLLASCTELLQPVNNYKSYKTALYNAKLPCLPFLGNYLTDLTFINDGNKTMVDGEINFKKCEMIAKVLYEMKLFQSKKYDFWPLDLYQNFFQEFCIPASEEERWALSRAAEPPAKSK